MHKTLFFSLLCLTLFLGCTKMKKDTSPYTSSEYFTCLVNGEAWVASTPNNPNGPSAISAHYEADYDQLDIFATRKDQNANPTVYDKVLLLISHPGSLNPRVYIGHGNTAGFCYLLSADCATYYYDSLYPASCTIENWDFENRRVTGTFQIQLRNKNCSDSVLTISSGQFSCTF